jgi:hypothetical protein
VKCQQWVGQHRLALQFEETVKQHCVGALMMVLPGKAAIDQPLYLC